MTCLSFFAPPALEGGRTFGGDAADIVTSSRCADSDPRAEISSASVDKDSNNSGSSGMSEMPTFGFWPYVDSYGICPVAEVCSVFTCQRTIIRPTVAQWLDLLSLHHLLNFASTVRLSLSTPP